MGDLFILSQIIIFMLVLKGSRPIDPREESQMLRGYNGIYVFWDDLSKKEQKNLNQTNNFMKKLLILFSIIVSIVFLTSCEQSEGAKFGVLQKVSHKTFPCEYYEIQVAYEGGVMKSTDDNKSSSYENTQDIKIDKAAADTLDKYIGDKVVFDYSDNGFAACGTSKVLTSLRIKNN